MVFKESSLLKKWLMKKSNHLIFWVIKYKRKKYVYFKLLVNNDILLMASIFTDTKLHPNLSSLHNFAQSSYD